MADQQMRIRIGADVQDAVRGLNTVQDRMRSTAAAGQSFGTGIQTSAVKASKALTDIKKPANDATRSLIDMGRIAQDLPYGFLGIANNLNPALEGLQRLSASAKEAGTSVGKELVNALKGPAGLGFALSVVSSLMISFGGSLFSAGNDAKRMQKEVDNLTASLEAQKKAIDDLVSFNSYSSTLDKLRAKAGGASEADVFKVGQAANQRDITLLRQEYNKATQAVRDFDNARNEELKKARRLPGLRNFVFSDSQKEAQQKQRQLLVDNASRLNDQLIEVIKKGNVEQAQEDVRLYEEKQKSLKTHISKVREIINVEIPKLPKLPIEIVPTLTGVGQSIIDDLEAARAKLQERFGGRQQQRVDNLGGIRGRIAPDVDLKGKLAAADFELRRRQAEELSKEIGDRLIPVTDAFVNLITGAGDIKSVFESIVGVIRNVVKELAQAAIQALIFKAILGPGGGSFGDVFKGILGVGGGGVAGLGNVSAGGINVVVSGVLRGRGQDLNAIITNANASSGRSF